ncbi:uncharacterized protein LOC135223975 [Macrobrachium nipponense]|uniref:uncharacterized protein LOC135223975 n=1 Tax=Macrobrachium nipponense TaxID=159736 RepID=UPI0030C8B7A5
MAFSQEDDSQDTEDFVKLKSDMFQKKNPPAFRSWRRSMECWIELCRLPPHEVVHHIRLYCTPPLQQALDARFTSQEWSNLTATEAMDFIRDIVLRSTNCAVLWSEFFNATQGPGESVSDYFLKCSQNGHRLQFPVPSVSLTVGLSDEAMRRHVYQCSNDINSVSALRARCCAYEAARVDAAARQCNWRETALAAGSEISEADHPNATIAGTGRGHPPPPCGNCGSRHKMKCTECAGTKFTEDSGLRTCDFCGTEVRDFVALESQEFLSNLDVSQITRIKKERFKNDDGREITLGVCETYNIILNSWTKAMLSLGASHRFEKIMFELWMWYLQRSNMAFSQEDDSQDTEDFVKLKSDMFQKKKYCYFPSAANIEGSSIPNVVHLRIFPNMPKKNLPDNLSLAKLLSLVYLAIVLAEEPILLMDLIRWCREGHLPYFSAHNLLPPGCKSEVTKGAVVIEADIIKENGINMAMLLNVLYFPIPDYRYVIDRVVKPLRLPVYVGDMALELMKKLFTASNCSNKISVLGIEIYAIAAVVRVLKDFWGLNDYDEYYLSIATRRINEEIGKKSSIVPLFCWEEWQTYINKLIWYCGEIDYITSTHSRKVDFCNLEARSFSRFAWTEGIWRQGSYSSTDTPGIITTQCWSYAEKLLDAQDTTVETQVNQPFVYKPTQLPIHGIVEQFVNSCGKDSKYGHLLQVGKELMDINFSDHLFKLPAIGTLQEELKRCGSDLQIVTTIPKTSQKENKLLLFIPQPFKCAKQSDFRIKLLDVKIYPSRSIEWLLAICFIFFDVNGYEVLQSIKMFKEIYPRKLWF